MEILKKIINSKKFLYAIGTIILVNCSGMFGIDSNELNSIILIAIALIIAQGISDSKKGCKK
jgi:hypothetical protein